MINMLKVTYKNPINSKIERIYLDNIYKYIVIVSRYRVSNSTSPRSINGIGSNIKKSI